MLDDRLYDEKELEKSWLLSYSDLITLLFVIVVIVAATSSLHVKDQLDQLKQTEAKQAEQQKEMAAELGIFEAKKKKLEAEIAVMEAYRDQLTGSVSPLKTEVEQVERSMETVKTQLSAALQEFNIEYRETEEGLVIRLPEKVLFTSGSADLEQEGKQTVGAIAAVLQKFPNQIRIEGYTDNTPILHSSFPSNWELSSARALAVMREMVDGHGLAPTRFLLAGWGEHQPLNNNITPTDQADNRRVEIVILADRPF